MASWSSMVQGPLNGMGFLLALERSDGTWDAVAQQHSWVS